MRTLFDILSTITGLIVAGVVSSMATGDTHLESDGKSVTVAVDYPVVKAQIAVVKNWLGVAADRGESGDDVALDISPVERQFTVPAALGASNGDTIYITVADLNGHTPNDSAYSLSAGAGKVAFFKATCDQNGTFITGIVLPNVAS